VVSKKLEVRTSLGKTASWQPTFFIIHDDRESVILRLMCNKIYNLFDALFTQSSRCHRDQVQTFINIYVKNCSVYRNTVRVTLSLEI